MENGSIESLQHQLQFLGYPIADKMGTFGDDTLSAVKAFQRRKLKTAASGVVDRKLRNRVLAEYEKAVAPGTAAEDEVGCIVRGRVINRRSSKGEARVAVEAWDADSSVESLLGSKLTDSGGWFALALDPQKAGQWIQRKSPGVYFKVLRNGREVPSTGKDVLWKPKAADQPVVIRVDLATSAASSDEALPHRAALDFQGKLRQFGFLKSYPSGFLDRATLSAHGEYLRAIAGGYRPERDLHEQVVVVRDRKTRQPIVGIRIRAGAVKPDAYVGLETQTHIADTQGRIRIGYRRLKRIPESYKVPVELKVLAPRRAGGPVSLRAELSLHSDSYFDLALAAGGGVVCVNIAESDSATAERLVLDDLVFEALPTPANGDRPVAIQVLDDLPADGRNELWINRFKEGGTDERAARILFPVERFANGASRVVVACLSKMPLGPILEAYDDAGALLAAATHSAGPATEQELVLEASGIRRIDVIGSIVALTKLCYEGTAAAASASIAEVAEGVLEQPCECDPCTSALSPAAYFVDLYGFVASTFDRTDTWVEDRLRQPLASTPLNCQTVESQEFQIGFANRVLANFIAERRGLAWRQLSADVIDAIYAEFRTLPSGVFDLMIWVLEHRGWNTEYPSAETLTAIYNEFGSYLGEGGMAPEAVFEAFTDVLRELSTTSQAVQAALAGGAAGQAELAERLGLPVEALEILARNAEEVAYGDLVTGIGLLETAKVTLLFRSLRKGVYLENYTSRLDELLAAIEEGDAGAPADETAAIALAEAHADAAATAVEGDLMQVARTEAAVPVADAVDRVYEAFLPKARRNLCFIAHNEARRNHWDIPVITSTQLLGDYLHVDLSVDACHRIPYIGFLLETLQDLLLSVKLGDEDSSALSQFDDRRWSWMKSYGIWHAVQFVFLHPSNLLLPSLRRLGDEWLDLSEGLRASGWSDFFKQMVGWVDEQPRVDLGRAQAALDALAANLRAIQGIRISHTIGCEGRLYLFAHGNPDGDRGRIFYSVIDGDETWSGWQKLDLYGLTPRTSGAYCLQDLLVQDGKVYVFLLVEEDKRAVFVGEQETGAFGVPQDVDGAAPVSFLRAISIERNVGSGVNRINPKHILVFHADPTKLNQFGYYYEFFVTSIVEGQSELLEEAKLAFDQYKGLVDAGSYLEDRVSFAPEYFQKKGSSVLFMVQVRGYSADNEVRVFGRTSHENALNTDDYIWEKLTTGNRRLQPLPDVDSQWVRIDVPGTKLEPDAGLGTYDTATTLAAVRTQAVVFDGVRTLTVLNDALGAALSRAFYYDPLETAHFESVALLPRRIFAHHRSGRLMHVDFSEVRTYGRLTLAARFGLDNLRVTVQERGKTNWGRENYPSSTPAGRQQLLLHQLHQYGVVGFAAPAARYLDELFLYAPLYLAAKLNEEERFDDAIELVSVVFQPFLTPAEAETDLAAAAFALPSGPASAWPVWPSTDLGQHFLSLRVHRQAALTANPFAYRSTREYLDNPLLPYEVAERRALAYARNAVQHYLENTLDWADEEFARDTPESIPRARELYENARQILAMQELPPELCQLVEPLTLPAEAAMGGESSTAVAHITRRFCIPRNPLTEVYRFRAESNLEKIESCRNIAGVRRALQSYATPVDPTALVEAAAAGLDLDDFVPSEPPPLFRYSVLLERARHVVQIAAQFEAHYLSALEKYDDETYTVLRARNDLRLSTENVSLHNLQLRRANESVSLARLQQERAQISAEYFQGLIEDGYSLLEELGIGFMIGAAGAHATAAISHGVAAYQGGGADSVGSAASATAAALQTTASVLQTYAAYDRREQEWSYQRDLANQDISIASQGLRIASTDVKIAEKQQGIAALSSQFAQDTVEFLTSTQFTNAELYYWMKNELRKLYRKQLNMAHATARAAQQALAFELQEPLNIIGFQYGDVRREGLLGAEKLTYDLEKLEQHRLSQAERRREITEHLSLGSLMPAEFQRFKRTGVLQFTTSSSIFDRRFPGHYQRLIRSVELSVFALTAPGTGIRATLTNHGISRVMVGAPFSEPTVVQRPPEAVSLSSASSASGLFLLRLDDPMLLPFEGGGVEATWTLEMLKGANLFDFDTIFDVVMAMRYTARDDWGYRQKVVARLREEYGNTRALSARVGAPDSWYHFHNPAFAGAYAYDGSNPLPPYTVEFDVTEKLLPPNEADRKIKRVIIAADLSAPVSVPFSVTFVPRVGPGTTAGNKVLGTEGHLSLLDYYGRAPYGKWYFTLDTGDTAVNSGLHDDFFAGASMVNGERRVGTSVFRDLLLIVDYEATLQY